ncbi:GI17927, related [Neospora caninum Liverpool]|uniref:GI17927, related n=1 Tax=Neospora caninum (strain Liverpool) TaxID=572307 RepID=F0VHX5_NEOCL|nr:GI17927, related [Neospora caninum Liverpool]CBZ53336.1 GI17927, related [Neospora caninum Liverpool]CEL67321.1 TPA: GI17927, related [Neospora caninum Liverpool]|eukprot:XP_003883368.1 GI17927, related [Neospora caninum Liverpool]
MASPRGARVPPSGSSRPPQGVACSQCGSPARPLSRSRHNVASPPPHDLPFDAGGRSPSVSPQNLRLEALQRETFPAAAELYASSRDSKAALSPHAALLQKSPSQRAASSRSRNSPSQAIPSYTVYHSGGFRAATSTGADASRFASSFVSPDSFAPSLPASRRGLLEVHSPERQLTPGTGSSGRGASPLPSVVGSPPQWGLPRHSPTARNSPSGAEIDRARRAGPETPGSPCSDLPLFFKTTRKPGCQARVGAASCSRNILQEQGRRVVQFGAASNPSPFLSSGGSGGKGREKAAPDVTCQPSLSPNLGASGLASSTGRRTSAPMDRTGGLRGQAGALETAMEEREREASVFSSEANVGRPGVDSEFDDREISQQGLSPGETSPAATRVENESVVAQGLRKASLFGALSHRSFYYQSVKQPRRPSSSPSRRVTAPAGRKASPFITSYRPTRDRALSSASSRFPHPTLASSAAILGHSVRRLPPLTGRKYWNAPSILPPCTSSQLGSPGGRRVPASVAPCGARPWRGEAGPKRQGGPAKQEGGGGLGLAKSGRTLSPQSRGQRAPDKIEVPSYLPTLCSIYLEGAPSESARRSRSTVSPKKAAQPTGGDGRGAAPGTRDSGVHDPPATTSTDLSTGAASVVAEQLLRAEGATAECQAQTGVGLGEEELKNMVSGEDAIAFFARYGAATSTKFLYCNRKKKGDADQYSLVVVPEKEAEPEHFTISATGIVHICPGRPSEYMTLSDFSHQAFAFSVLRSMLFFKTFLQRKLVALWRDNVRRLIYRRQRARLARRLFLAKPVFADHLMEILEILAELRGVPLVQVPLPGALYDLAAFTAMQTATRSDVKTGAAKAIEGKQQRVHRALQQLMTRLHEATLLPDADPLETGALSRSKSMVQASQEARERTRLLRLAFADEAQFGDFVRLVDSILAVRLVDAVTAAALKLRERLGEENACSKWFRVQVQFGEARVEFVPSRDQFQGALSELWDGTVSVVSGAPFFAANRLYEDFVKVRDRLSVERLLMNCSAFLQTKDDIERRLTRDFDRARRYADSYFAVYRQIYDYGQAWDEAAVCASLRSHDELSNELEAMRDFQTRLEKLNPTHVVGLFSIQAHDLKTALSPITEDALAALKRLLLQRTREHLRATVARYEQTNAALDSRPTKLLPFAEFVKTYKFTRSQIDELDHAQATAEDMFQLLKQYEVRVAVEDTILLETLNKNAALFEKEKLLGAAEHIRRHLDAMLADVKQQSAQVEQETQAISTALSEEQFQNVKLMEAALAVLESLHSYDRQIEDLDAKATTLQQTQKLLNPDGAFVFKHTEAAKKLVKPKLKLWTCVYEWQAATTQWSQADVSQLNGEEVQTRVKTFLTTLQFLHCELPNDSVVEALKQQVELWRTRLPTLLDLNNPALRPRHWAKIFRALHLDREATGPVPLELLEAAGIFSHGELVAEVSSRASAERALEATLERLRGTLDQMDFATKPLVDNPDCFLLDDVGDLVTQLEESAVALQSMLFSPYVAELRAQVEAWKAKLDLTVQVLKEMVAFQRAWVAFEGVFANGDLDHWFASEAAAFRQMNEFWADTMRRIRTETANVLATTTRPGFYETLQQFNFVVGRVQKSIAVYLETKRQAFPRFYFLSDEELLKIVAAGHSLDLLQSLLPKCFDGVQRVVFTTSPSPPARPSRSVSTLLSLPRTSSAAPSPQTQPGEAGPFFPAQAPPARPTQAPVPSEGAKADAETAPDEARDGDEGPPIVASGMISSDGEFVQFCDLVVPSEVPETCFLQMEQSMKFALYSLLQEAWRNYPAAPLARSSSTSSFSAALAKLQEERETVSAFETKRASVTGNANLGRNYLNWLRQHPSQCLALADALVFTALVERALDRDRRVEERDGERDRVEGFEGTEERRERRISEASSTSGGTGRKPETLAACRATVEENITRLVVFQRRKGFPLKTSHAEALITQLVHRRDVVASLEEAKCASSSEFEWQKHLRYYWNSDVDDCFVRQQDMSFQYAYELSECPRRLVITPLTEKCFLTLTGALRLSYGGATTGPAGTGKTETIKDLAKAVGVPCVVFNCSAELDCQMTSRLFSGLAQAGAWSCLDEFNRIDVEVLSVVAQQMRSVQTAARANLDEFEFEGRNIRLNKRYGVFVSMNPGYAGRAELPENLKSLFRPVAMVAPDLVRIAEVTLFSSGFRTAETLAKKLITVFEAAAKQLSDQPHYDFGMRAVKSVLSRAASLKEKTLATTDEDYLLVTAVTATTLPRLLEGDCPVFLGLVSDTFPECAVGAPQSLLLKKAIEAELRRRDMQVSDTMVTKALQLHETQSARVGVMVVGAPGTGKTSCISVLAAAMTDLAQRSVGHGEETEGESEQESERQNLSTDQDAGGATRIVKVNPKALELASLFGETNEATKEWTDGIVGMEVRKAAQEAGRKWFVFDGPLDALWVENLNSALDDNKVLCLTSGERTKLPPSLTFVFEVDSLANASPATVSRCGVVYLEDRDRRGVDAFIQSWAQQLEKEFPSYASNLRRWTLEICMDALPFIKNECTEAAPSLDMTRVATLCRLTSSWLSDEAVFPREDEEREALLSAMYWTLAVVWGLGGSLSEESRPKLSRFLLPRLRAKCPEIGELGEHVDLFALSVHPESLSFVSLRSLLVPRGPPPPARLNSGRLGHKNECGEDADTRLTGEGGEAGRQSEGRVPAERLELEGQESLHEIFIPTEQTVAEKMLLDQLLAGDMSCFLCGETGQGKTASATAYMRELPHEVGRGSLRLTARTGARSLQALLEWNLVRRRRLALGPPADQTRVLLHLDDVNMPTPDASGAQQPLEFLRHLLDSGGFYDPQNLQFKTIQETHFLLVAAPPHGGRPKIWNFDSLDLVFGPLLREWMTRNLPTLEDLREKLVTLTLDTYLKVPPLLLPTPFKPHYTSDLRDLAHVLQGIMLGDRNAITDDATLVKLWFHETSRQFEDGLVSSSDRLLLHEFLTRQVSRHLGLAASAAVASSPFVFTALSHSGRFTGPYKLMDGDGRELEQACSRALEEYQLNPPPSPHARPLVNFVFFADARKHLLRLCRILALPRGNALLLGVEGCGRQSLTHIAAHVVDETLYTIHASSRYGAADFRQDLKRVLQNLASDKKPVVFLLADSQIRHEQFLEDLVSLMVAGEIPDLFDREEREHLLLAGRRSGPEPPASSWVTEETLGGSSPTFEAPSLGFRHPGVGFPAFSDAEWLGFTQAVRKRLHVVLAISPVGQSLRSRCRQFPGLRSCTTVDYFDSWPKEALVCVANHLYTQQPNLIPPQDVAALSAVSSEIHASAVAAQEAFCREPGHRAYATGSSFVQFLQTHLHLRETETAVIQEKTQRYRRGISRLEDTTKLVEQLKHDLLKTQPVLEASKRDTQQLMAALERDRQRADEVEGACDAERRAADAARAEAQSIKDDCEGDINRVLPELLAALKALDALDKKDIQELKSFLNPPALVETVLQAVCLLVGRKQTWEEAKKLLNETSLLQQLRDFDRDHVPSRLLAQVQKFTASENFTPEKVNQVSKAATSLCMWVRAVERYAVVTREMEPKKERLAIAEAALAAAEETLAEKHSVLRKVHAGIRLLENRIQASRERAEDLQAQIADAQVRLARAEKLLRGVATEAARWSEEARQLDEKAETLSADMLLSAGMLSYGGPFTAAYRKSLTDQWLAKCGGETLRASASFSLLRVLSSPEEERELNLQGLPGDRLSLENAVIATHAVRRNRWPLLLDPQGQARKWLRRAHTLWSSFSSSSHASHSSSSFSASHSSSFSASHSSSSSASHSSSSSSSSSAVFCSEGSAGASDATKSLLGSSGESGEKERPDGRTQEGAGRARETERDQGVPSFSGCPRTNQPPNEGAPASFPDGESNEITSGPASARERRGHSSPDANVAREAQEDSEEEKGNSQEFQVKLNSRSPTFLDQLANAVSIGAHILVELAEDFLDPVIDQFLEKPTSPLVHAGGPVSWNPDFRLVFVTSHANPSFGPGVFSRVTVINFAVTAAGLEEQLLIEVVKHERPELEEQRDALVVAIAEDTRRKQLIEEDILSLLAGATGDILSNDTLVDMLAASRSTAEGIQQRMRVAEETAKTLDRARDLYRGVSARGALLFFVVAALSRLDAMYRQSLHSFLRIFRQVLEQTDREQSDVAQRVALLQRELNLQVYRKTCHGLFERHKFCFAFLIALAIDKARGVPLKEEYDFLTRGCPASGELHARVKDVARDRRVAWLAEKNLQQVIYLDSLGGNFAGVVHAVLANPEAWQRFVASDFDFSSSLPDGFEEKLSPFQALLLTKALRPEDLVHAARKYVLQRLGVEFVEPPPRSLSDAFRGTSARTPMLFLLSSGVDPSEEIRRLAEEVGADRGNLHTVSLGQGQAARAAALVAKARETGGWVCLQNCHLAHSFMPTLQSLHEERWTVPLHRNFRLFLTSMPCPSFPTSLLESSIKITSEPPAGLKAHLLRTYTEREETRDAVMRAVEERRDFQRLFFGLAFFHAAALERRKFGAIGWNNFYDWTPWDCLVSQRLLTGYIAATASSGAAFPFDALTFSTAQLNYGGRVTDARDLRALDALLRSFVSEKTLAPEFAPPQSPLYRFPDVTTFDGCRQYIERLPLQDPPEVFGLPRNASLMLKEREAHEFLSSIAATHRPRSSESAKTRHFSDLSVAKLVNELLNRLPPLLDRHQAHASAFEAKRNSATKMLELDPLAAFLSHEVLKFNALLQVVRASLRELQQAMSGNALMSATVEETYQALVDQRVPPAWARVSYASMKPLAAWFTDMGQRVEHIREWMTRGQPKSFWLPAYFSPDALLAAAIQAHARQYKVPVDCLTLKATVVKARASYQLAAFPPRGIYVHGLFLQGAGWNASEQRLCESELGVLFEPMPVILLEPGAPVEERRTKEEPRFYSCPLYKTPERKGVGNYIHSLDLPTDHPPVHWILRGVALLCQDPTC